MKLLHIDTSITGENSVSRQVAAAIVERLRETIPNLVVTYRDLASAPLPHLSVPPGSPQGAEADGQAAIDEFLAADIVVIGAPMYNFTIPSQLKAWMTASSLRARPFATARRASKDSPAISG
jgi:FMN-dependent NADH-azoreductase